MSLRFWSHTRNANIASYRLRCLHVAQRMRARGFDADLLRPGEAAPRVLVLSKRYDSDSLARATQMRQQAGTRLVLDLSDNHFYTKTADPAGLQRAAELRDAVRAVDSVVACSEYLREAIRAEAGGDVPVTAIGDIVEAQAWPSFTDQLRHPIEVLRLRHLRHTLRRQTPQRSHRLVWFGNSGSDFVDGGMSDLGLVRPILETVHERAGISLTVISNSADLFVRLTRDWSVPSHYLPWHSVTFSTALRLHGTSIIPIGRNPFTLAKTGNRVTTSLVHGLGVVADLIPSYDEFLPEIHAGNWEDNLCRLVEEDLPAPSRWSDAQVEQRNESVIDQWMHVVAVG